MKVAAAVQLLLCVLTMFTHTRGNAIATRPPHRAHVATYETAALSLHQWKRASTHLLREALRTNNGKICVTVNDLRSFGGAPSTTSPRGEEEEEEVEAVVKVGAYLSDKWLGSKTRAYNLCKQGLVFVNNRKVYSCAPLRLGDVLTFSIARSNKEDIAARGGNGGEDEEATPTYTQAEQAKIHRLVRLTKEVLSKSAQALGCSDEEAQMLSASILYEDDHMAIVFKPAGIHTLGWLSTFQSNSLTFDEILPLLLLPPPPHSPFYGETLARPLPCHRLDARVSGPVCIAKTHRALASISKLFASRKVTKEYLAVLVGALPSWCLPKDKDKVDEKDSLSVTFPVLGKAALTKVELVNVSVCSVYGHLSTVRLFPVTGRRHQLRRHCAALGCPIVGDDLYHSAAFANAGDERIAAIAVAAGEGKENEVEREEEEEEMKDIMAAAVDAPPIPWATSNANEIPRVRKGDGLYLTCNALSLPHPINENEIISVRVPESKKYEKVREKGVKGHEWKIAHKAAAPALIDN